jgi:hypothetical protein
VQPVVDYIRGSNGKFLARKKTWGGPLANHGAPLTQVTEAREKGMFRMAFTKSACGDAFIARSGDFPDRDY